MAKQWFSRGELCALQQSLLQSSLPPPVDWLDFEAEAVREALYWAMKSADENRDKSARVIAALCLLRFQWEDLLKETGADHGQMYNGYSYVPAEPEYPRLTEQERVRALTAEWSHSRVDRQVRELRHALRIIPAYFGSNLNREWESYFKAATEQLQITMMLLEIVHNLDYRLLEGLEMEEKS
ncbi:unnamed protein product [Symbiodinium sp. CCMP2592]|nr:unnamed protein product [Symbiodinium sp. CCMP2592]